MDASRFSVAEPFPKNFTQAEFLCSAYKRSVSGTKEDAFHLPNTTMNNPVVKNQTDSDIRLLNLERLSIFRRVNS